MVTLRLQTLFQAELILMRSVVRECLHVISVDLHVAGHLTLLKALFLNWVSGHKHLMLFLPHLNIFNSLTNAIDSILRFGPKNKQACSFLDVSEKQCKCKWREIVLDLL